MLGFSQSEVSDENLTSKKDGTVYFGTYGAGRASEEVFCEDITNGAFNDIEKGDKFSKTIY